MQSDENKKRQELLEVSDLFYLALIDADPSSLLAEVHSMIGFENTKTFIEIFGGTSIRVPTMATIKKAVLSASVWADHVRKTPSEEICSKYGMTVNRVMAIINRWAVLQNASQVPGYAQ